MRVRALAAAVWIAAAGAAAAQSLEPDRGEFGARYWLSTGETRRSHNAQSVDPSLGNPTSVLTYENLDANALELLGRAMFARDWFVKGIIGVGKINTGMFRDEDFNAGQVKFSDTSSSVSAGWIGYGWVDVGRQWTIGSANTVGVYAGYSQWVEEVDASGATDHLGFIGGDIPRGVKVITNKVIWKALRLGIAAQFALAERLRLGADLAAIPYAEYRDEDSHHLRTDPGDLGPAPNIILSGKGQGLQLEAELRYEVARRTDLALGWRYWYMESTEGDRRLPNFPSFPQLPVVELYSKRQGATLTLTHRW